LNGSFRKVGKRQGVGGNLPVVLPLQLGDQKEISLPPCPLQCPELGRRSAATVEERLGVGDTRRRTSPCTSILLDY